MDTKKLVKMSVGIFIIFCFTQTGIAGDEINFGSKIPSVDEITNALVSEPEKKVKTSRTRGFTPAVKPLKKPKAISMQITFEKNSYRLTSKAKKILNAVGKAFNTDALYSSNFIIEGHTDASGADSYNLKLSQQRAKAVKTFLVKKHGIDLDRLETIGKGEYELMDKENPYSGKNRRVKIITSGN